MGFRSADHGRPLGPLSRVAARLKGAGKRVAEWSGFEIWPHHHGGYDGARSNRRLRGWRAPRLTINTLLAESGETLRARARQLCRENPYASNAASAFQASAVGAGIKPSSLIADPDKKRSVQQAWTIWTDECDADGITDFYGLQALVARALFEAGECFVQFVDVKPGPDVTVPLKLRLLESEMLDLSYNLPLPDGRSIRNGIEFDAAGRRVAYHFWAQHPGEYTLPIRDMTRVVVPASEVLHIFEPLRPGQMRGQPKLTPAMIRLYLLDQYDDAELERKKVAALFAGFITKRAPEDEAPIATLPQGGGPGQPPLPPAQPDVGVAQLEPGTIQVLLEGEDIKFSTPAEVGGSYEAFMWRQLLAIASACGLTYAGVTGDASKSNYSSSRETKVTERRRLDQFQHMVLVFQLCRPIWLRWFRTAVLAKAIAGVSASEYQRARATVLAVKWIPPKWDWVDPLKDRTAEKLAVDAGFKSRSDVIEAEGYDPEEVDERIAADRKREQELGLDFRPLTDKQIELAEVMTRDAGSPASDKTSSDKAA